MTRKYGRKLLECLQKGSTCRKASMQERKGEQNQNYEQVNCKNVSI